MDLMQSLHDRTGCITSEVNNKTKFGARHLHYNLWLSEHIVS
jgi:hypothetical protein